MPCSKVWLTMDSLHTDNLKDVQESEREESLSWPCRSHYFSTILMVLAFAFLLRVLLSFQSYSGASTPPKFGDYEAQRHWMEITVHNPVTDWYRNTTDNDLGWWGLDYPPLTAYQSYLHGLVVHALEPDAVALRTSRGYETPSSKVLMRWTVLSSDLLVFFPAALWFVNAFYNGHCAKQRVWALAVVLLQPALMIIDHGHFQYNCISLGLAVGAAAALVSGKELLACILFSLSINHKQMSMYYAPAFFAHLLGRSLHAKNPLLRVLWPGCTVILTFTLCWWPFLRSGGAALEVLSRIAPLQRGLYEDYVANFWCGTATVFRWKRVFSQPTLAKIALGATISASLPSMVQQLLAPSGRGFIYAMLNSSFAFYFFSYQVHEKSILLPIIPASLLALEKPEVIQWLVPFGMFSMLPLLVRDQQLLAYFSLAILFLRVVRHPVQPSQKNALLASTQPKLLHRRVAFASFAGAVVLHVMYFVLQPPDRYQFIFEAFIMAYSFAHFVLLAAYTNWTQWSIPADLQVKLKIT